MSPTNCSSSLYVNDEFPTIAHAVSKMQFSERAPSDEHVYRRPLPSGGYVAIATQPVKRLFADTKIRGHVVVERRSQERRIGHSPPIVAIAECENVDGILEALLPVAESDEVLQTTLAQRVTIPITPRRARPES